MYSAALSDKTRKKAREFEVRMTTSRHDENRRRKGFGAETARERKKRGKGT